MHSLLAVIPNRTTDSGVALGAVIAVVCSWQRNRSILWAILHAICSWFYVLYFAATRRPDEEKAD